MIENDKFYTPIEIANHCWEVIDKVIGIENIDIVIDSSCGGGAFEHYEKRKVDYCIDIEPEIEDKSQNVIKKDYFEWLKEFKWNLNDKVLVGFNPPFGLRNHLAQKFFKESIRRFKWVAFILPINQLNNSYTFKEGKLLYSEELPEVEYSGVKLKCCFNIYEQKGRYENDDIATVRSADIKIYRHDENVKVELKSSDIKMTNTVAGGKHNPNYDLLEDYDVRFVYFGSGCAGKVFLKGEGKKSYAGEYKIKIDEGNKDKQAIIDFIRTFDWNGNCKSISMKRISKQEILHELNKRFDINQTREMTIFDWLEKGKEK